MSIARRFTQFSPREVSTLFSSARRFHRGYYWDILIAPRLHAHARFLVITSRSLGAAPLRNAIKRRVKSIFYEQAAYDLPYDIVVILKKSSLKLSFQALEIRLKEVFKALYEYEESPS